MKYNRKKKISVIYRKGEAKIEFKDIPEKAISGFVVKTEDGSLLDIKEQKKSYIVVDTEGREVDTLYIHYDPIKPKEKKPFDYTPIEEMVKQVEDAIYVTEKEELDLSPVLDALRSLKLSVESITFPDDIDYTDDLKKLLEAITARDFSFVESLLIELVDKPTPVFEIPQEMVSDNRLKVEVDRIGGSVGTDVTGIEQKLDTINESVNNGSIVDENNSTTTPLGAGAEFTGAATDILAYATLAILVHTDQDGTLKIQFSSNGTDWHDGESYTILAGATKFFTPPTQAKYYRVVYTNGAVAQTELHLHATLKKRPIKWSSHNIEDPITDEDDATLTKSVITGKKADGDYDNVSLTNGGNMKVSLEELESGISTNNNEQLNTSPHVADEYGNYNHILGDNGFKGAIIAIPPEHHEIHCGDSYTAHHVEDLGNGATHDYLIITPDWGNPVSGNDPFGNQAIKVAHLVGEISGEAETEFWFYESPTVTANGNALTVLNRNRNSSNADLLTMYEGATISVVGTELDHGKFGSGKLVGGGANRTDEWVLKNNTTYLLRIRNNTTSNNYHTLKLQYYVHAGV